MNPVDKIKKLLVHSQNCGTAEESAAFAARARELMTKFQIEETDISLSQGTEREVEKVEEALLEDTGSRRARLWRVNLACGLASAFNSRCYYVPGSVNRSSNSTIHIVGRPSDAQAVRYLHSYLCLEIGRLAEEGYRAEKEEAAARGLAPPRPSSWKESFRLGAANVVTARLAQQRNAERAAFQAAARGQEVFVDAPTATEGDDGAFDAGPVEAAPPEPTPLAASTALALVGEEERVEKEIDVEWKRIMGPRGGGRGNFSGRRNYGGYAAGSKAGAGIRLGTSGRGLPRPATRIGSL